MFRTPSLKVGDLKFLPRDKRFVLPMNRFAWETQTACSRPSRERRNSVLHFERVHAARATRRRAQAKRATCCRCWRSASLPARHPAASSNWCFQAAALSASMSNASRRGFPISAARGKPRRARSTGYESAAVAITLRTIRCRFRGALRALPRDQARGLARRRCRRSRASSPRFASAAMRRCSTIRGNSTAPILRALGLAGDPRRHRRSAYARGRCRHGRGAEICARPHSFAPRRPAAGRRPLHRRARRRTRLADGRRSRRSAFTCRAAPPPIRVPC